MAKKVESSRDELSSILANNLNKKFKTAHKVAFFLDGQESTPTDLDDWVSTGSPMLDLAIANRPNGGLPVGRITEITGLEGSGKSLLAAHAIADTQKKGGYGVYIDTENAMNQDFLTAIGVDIKKMLYVPLETVEDIFEAIDSIIESIRAADGSEKKLVTIVVDSVAGATTKVELAADYDQAGYATQKAIIISKAMRKVTNLIGRERICLIFTNQLRTRMGVSFGDPWTTSGGKAIAFHSSCRLRLKQMGQLKSKVGGIDQVVGIKTRAQVIKNRMGPPLRSIDYDIYFDSGIDNYGSWLEMMKNYKLVTQSGAWYTYIDKQTGEEIKFQAKNFEEILLERPVMKDNIYKDICETYIMSYKESSASANIDNVELTDFDD
jgi:recombination protein RecA|tara:strand:+ start:1446 stop:2582 length:1137 start_codon:yes stop_codon:yes gene_type:complete